MNITGVTIVDPDWLPEGSPARIVAEAIRLAALDATRSPKGTGTAVIDCAGRAMDLVRRLGL